LDTIFKLLNKKQLDPENINFYNIVFTLFGIETKVSRDHFS